MLKQASSPTMKQIVVWAARRFCFPVLLAAITLFLAARAIYFSTVESVPEVLPRSLHMRTGRLKDLQVFFRKNDSAKQNLKFSVVYNRTFRSNLIYRSIFSETRQGVPKKSALDIQKANDYTTGTEKYTSKRNSYYEIHKDSEAPQTDAKNIDTSILKINQSGMFKNKSRQSFRFDAELKKRNSSMQADNKHDVILHIKYRNITTQQIKRSLNYRQENIIPNQIGQQELEIIYRNISEYFQIRNSQHKDPLLNLHHFVFNIDSKFCDQPDLYLLTFVHSAPEGFEDRRAIRKTWGSVRISSNKTIATVFILAQTQNQTIQKRLEDEAKEFGDIVQGNFLDSYRNLTYKHIMAIGWVLSHCLHVRLVLKVDDDVVVHPDRLLRKFDKKEKFLDAITCSVYFRQGPVRRKDDKWYVPESLYPFRKYPDYCEGFAYVTSIDVLKKLYRASENFKFYWIDDVYVTGFLRQKLGITIDNMVEIFRNTHDATPDITNVIFVQGRYGPSMYEWWNIFQKKSSNFSVGVSQKMEASVIPG